MKYGTIEIHAGQASPCSWLNRPRCATLQRNDDRRAHRRLRRVGSPTGRCARWCLRAGARCSAPCRSELDEENGRAGFEENRKDARAFGGHARTAACAREADGRARARSGIRRRHGAYRRLRYRRRIGRNRVQRIRGPVGLTPATISPYVLAAMGERAAHRLFPHCRALSGGGGLPYRFRAGAGAARELDATVNAILGELVQGAPAAARGDQGPDPYGRKAADRFRIDGRHGTRIAAARASAEGREGVRAFLEKRKPPGCSRR